MSKRTMTNSISSKFMQVSFAFIFTLITLFSVNKYSNEPITQIRLITSCIAVESNLPMNHVNHPCQTSNMSNKSWLTWLSGESKSTHLHFLNLVELIHYSFH